MTVLRHRPAPGRRIRKPDGTYVADQGEVLPANTYFARLIAAGDLVPVKQPKPAKTSQGSQA